MINDENTLKESVSDSVSVRLARCGRMEDSSLSTKLMTTKQGTRINSAFLCNNHPYKGHETNRMIQRCSKIKWIIISFIQCCVVVGDDG